MTVSSFGESEAAWRSWLIHPGVGGTDIHGFTMEAPAEAETATCEPLVGSGKHTLGVNGVGRPSSVAVINEIGGDGLAAGPFLVGGENLISRVDQSVSGIC